MPDTATSTSVDPRLRVTIPLADALALIELADLIDDVSDDERAARTRLVYRVTGMLDGRPCPGCSTPVGQPHMTACEVAVCLWTGLARNLCAGRHPHVLHPDGGDLGLDPYRCGTDDWYGFWPGCDDADALGLFCYREPGGPRVECDRMHPDGAPDFARLPTVARWDRERARWVAR